MMSLRKRLAVLLLAASSAAALHAQAIPTASVEPSRFELYGGYGYFNPGTSDIYGHIYETQQPGTVASISGYFTPHFGLQLEGSLFPRDTSSSDPNCVYTAQAGPIARTQFHRFVPFVHALGGAAKIGGPAQQTCSVWGWGVTGGLGVDYIVPRLNNHLSVRLVQADYMYSQIDNGPIYLPGAVVGGFGEITAFRLTAGISLRLGGIPQNFQGGKADTSLDCTADPANAYPGDPITVSAVANNFRASKVTQYLWTSSGGKISGTESTETLSTAGLAPGTYTVGATLAQGKNDHPVASCTTTFTVRDFDPPSLSCSADRAAINSGIPVTITSVATSPQNRPLTYSYTASNGVVTGDGPTATLATNGTTPGTITVNCMVADDRGRSATAHTSVVIATPPAPAPIAQAQTLCSLSFDRDRKRPDRVDNAAKACLDDIALTLNRDPSTRLALIGNHGAGETDRDSAARTLNAAQYLTQEKGVDPNRIDLRIAAADGRTVATMLVPAGSTLDPTTGTAFDPSTVVRHGQPYGTLRKKRSN